MVGWMCVWTAGQHNCLGAFKLQCPATLCVSLPPPAQAAGEGVALTWGLKATLLISPSCPASVARQLPVRVLYSLHVRSSMQYSKGLCMCDTLSVVHAQTYL